MQPELRQFARDPLHSFTLKNQLLFLHFTWFSIICHQQSIFVHLFILWTVRSIDEYLRFHWDWRAIYVFCLLNAWNRNARTIVNGNHKRSIRMISNFTISKLKIIRICWYLLICTMRWLWSAFTIYYAMKWILSISSATHIVTNTFKHGKKKYPCKRWMCKSNNKTHIKKIVTATMVTERRS